MLFQMFIALSKVKFRSRESIGVYGVKWLGTYGQFYTPTRMQIFISYQTKLIDTNITFTLPVNSM